MYYVLFSADTCVTFDRVIRSNTQILFLWEWQETTIVYREGYNPWPGPKRSIHASGCTKKNGRVFF
jgi:hypothetical protein